MRNPGAWAAGNSTVFMGVLYLMGGWDLKSGGGSLVAVLVMWFIFWGVSLIIFDVLGFVSGDHPQRAPFHYHGDWGHAHKYANELHRHPFNDERIQLVSDGPENNRIIDLRH